MRTRDKMAIAFIGSSLIDTFAEKHLKDPKLSKILLFGSDTTCAIISTLAIIHHFEE